MNMSNSLFFVFILICLFYPSKSASAQEVNQYRYLHLTGTLGKVRVAMDLELIGNQASGRYYFDKMGQPIYIHDGDFEKEIPNFGKENMMLFENYGTWQGRLKREKFTGTWTSADGKKQLPFALTESYTQSVQMITLKFDNVLNSSALTRVKVHLQYPFSLKNGEALHQLKNEIGQAVVGISLPNMVFINRFKFEVLDKFEKDRDIKETTIESSVFLNESNLLTISAYQSGINLKGSGIGTIRSEYFTWDLLTGNPIVAKDIFVENYDIKLEKILQEVIHRDYEGKIFGTWTREKFGILKGGMMFFYDNQYVTNEMFVSYKELQSVLKPNTPIFMLMK
jgi:hypothetical protein